MNIHMRKVKKWTHNKNSGNKAPHPGKHGCENFML
jgi:hypothetical protein